MMNDYYHNSKDDNDINKDISDKPNNGNDI